MDYQILCRTKERRERLAGQLERLAVAAGAVLLDKRTLWGPRNLTQVFGVGPYRLTVDFDGDLPIDTWLGHWWVQPDSDATYPDHFGLTTDRNRAHRRKTTTAAPDWSRFLNEIRRCLEDLAAAETKVAA